MGRVKEEPKRGVPAFMATFADLMTLLLVFFILLNVYARERQHGLLAAASGSFARALHKDPGLGGMLPGSDYADLRNKPRATYAHRDEEGAPTQTPRRGDEVELKKSRAEALEPSEQVETAAPFTFERRSARLPTAGQHYLDGLARSVRRGSFVLEIEAAASFSESMQPMELASRRIESVIRYLRAVGVTAQIEPRAGVSDPKNGKWRGVRVRITRRR